MRKDYTNQWKILKIDTFFGGGGETQFYGQNDFMDIWAFLIKGQQLKGKLVSEFFTLFHTFHTFSEFFPQDFPFKTKGFSSMRTEEKKR